MTTATRSSDVDVLIIGAGMAGLSAAAVLQRAGRSVLLLDKGRGVGGRMATRRIGAATFDHGAQFFTARDPRFAAAIAHWQESGVGGEWCRGFTQEGDGHPRFRGTPAMTSVPKHLARDLDVLLETEVKTLRCVGEHWSAETSGGEIFHANAIVLTPPVPQSLALLDAAEFALAPEVRVRLTSIEYERCLAVMVALAGPSRISPPGGLPFSDGPIAWIADNQRKGVSEKPAVTIHASHLFSLEHWDRDREESGRILLAAADEWLGAKVETFEVHGWRYSKPLRVDDQPCLILNESPPLILAGDAFAGPRVEGAALSGWAAAAAVASRAAARPSC